jgi:hypothetical protein
MANTPVTNTSTSFTANTNPDYSVRKVTNPTAVGDIQIVTMGMALPDYDYISINYATGTQEIYTYKSGGASGTTVGIITVNYVDSTKTNITNVVKT